MTKSPAVMIFAAGQGTRMAPLTDNMPKPMIEVAGKPLIDHALDLVCDAGLTHVVANTHHKPGSLQSHLRVRGVSTIHEEVLLETGGGLRNALPLLGSGPVITLNSDAVWRGRNPVSVLRSAWRADEMDALLVLVQAKSALGHTGNGDFNIDVDRRLCRGTEYIFAGLQLLDPSLLHTIDDDVFSLNAVWDRMAARRRLFGIVYDGDWCDVGRPESIALAEAMLDV